MDSLLMSECNFVGDMPRNSTKKTCKFLWRVKIAWSRELILALVMLLQRIWLHGNSFFCPEWCNSSAETLLVCSQEGCSHIISYLVLFSGATVYMVCRSRERGEAALSKIRSTTGNPNIHLEVYCLKFLFLCVIHLTIAIDILWI